GITSIIAVTWPRTLVGVSRAQPDGLAHAAQTWLIVQVTLCTAAARMAVVQAQEHARRTSRPALRKNPLAVLRLRRRAGRDPQPPPARPPTGHTPFPPRPKKSL